MPARRRFVRRRIGRSRRKLIWATYQNAISINANGTTSVVDLLSQYRVVTGTLTAGTTIMRTHLRLFPTSTVTNLDGFNWGLIVDDEDQVVANSVDPLVDNPLTDVHNVWMFLQNERALPNYNRGMNALEYDIRSRRRISEPMQTFLLAVNPQVTSTPFQMDVFARTLLALP